VFFASKAELDHMLSGEPPNSFVPYYTKVNAELYESKGKLTEVLPGLSPNDALNTTLDMLHSGAHTAFSALLSGYAFATNPALQPYVEKLHRKVEINVHRLDWVHRLLVKGLTKSEVLEKFKTERKWRDELEQLKIDQDPS
jgi:hypothetical protein